MTVDGPAARLIDSPVVAAAHDAGGANLVSAMVSRGRFDPLAFVAEGPAQSIFARNHADVPIVTIENLTTAHSGDSFTIVTGTSGAATTERKILRWAQERDVASLTVLDHWVNYRQRFVDENGLTLPDEIAVTDDEAARRARAEFDIPIRVVPNDFTEAVTAEARHVRAERAPGSSASRILYLCEPVGQSPDMLAPEEIAPIKMLIEQAGQHGGRAAGVTLRPHPSEEPDKYRPLLDTRGAAVEISAADEPLGVALGRHDVAIGHHSYAMHLAYLAGLDVYSTADFDRLPHVLPITRIRPVGEFIERLSVD